MYICNLQRDLPDVRDWPIAKLLGDVPASLPSNDTHLRLVAPPIRDQGAIGSCTGFGTYRVARYAHKLAGFADPDLSPLFQYYNERLDMGTIDSDSGASIRQAMITAAKYGLCTEDDWRYNTANWRNKPSDAAYANALNNQVLEYYSVGNDITSIKQAINNGFAVTIGISVYQSFMNALNGDVSLPAIPNDKLVGGHNIVLDSYDDAVGCFGFANSWGTSWGRLGFGTISYVYISQLGFDGWVVKRIEGVVPAPGPVPPIPPTPTPAVLNMAVNDNRTNANVGISWNAVFNAASYLVEVGLQATSFSQKFNVGTLLQWSASYPRDNTVRYIRVSALSSDGATKLATSMAGAFGPASAPPAPPQPAPTPAPTPTMREVLGPNGISFSPKLYTP